MESEATGSARDMALDAFLEEIFQCMEEDIGYPWFVDSTGASPGGLTQPAATYSVGNTGPPTGTGMEEIPHSGSRDINVALTPTAPVKDDILSVENPPKDMVSSLPDLEGGTVGTPFHPHLLPSIQQVKLQAPSLQRIMESVDDFFKAIYLECCEEDKRHRQDHPEHHLRFFDSTGASPGGLTQPAATYSVGNAGPLTGTGMEEIPHSGSGEINVALTPTVHFKDILSFYQKKYILSVENPPRDMVSSSPDLVVNTAGPGLPSFDLCSAPSSPPPLSPSRIPCSEWEKRRCIGQGSFGQVFLGFNREHGQFCAIKEVQVILDDPHSEERLRKLNQEIDILKQLSHPNIVQYYDSIMTDSAFSIYMEYVSLGSIDKLLGKYGHFKESKIRIYTAQILSGLAFMHERNQVHRDIKGANILVGPNDEVKIADFGLAKHIWTETAVHTSNVGTAWWMAPEVFLSTHSREGYNLSADIWSLGCTVIEMATGKPPLHHLGKVAALCKIAFDNTYTPQIPNNLSDEGKDFLQLCLQRDRKRRPTAAQLLGHPFTRNQG